MTGETDFARRAQEVRRDLGLSVSTLSSRTGLDEATIAAAEAGERVTPSQVASICEGVGLPVWRYASGAPHGVVASVTPVDAEHGRTLRLIAEEAGSTGWLVTPDPAAHAAANQWTEASHAKAVSVGDRASNLSVLVAIGSAVVEVVGMSWIYSWWSEGRGRYDTDLSPLFVLATIALLVVTTVLVAFGWRGEQKRVSRESTLVAKAAEEMRRCGFVVNGDGVEQISVHRTGLSRRRYPATAVTSVAVRDEDAAHVTVRLTTLVGDLEMPWLPRARDVLDMVATWGDEPGTGAAKPALSGPQ